MNFFERRRYAKLVRHLLREARHARNMRGDVANADLLRQLRVSEDNLGAAWATRNPDQIEQAGEEISTCILKVNPPRAFPRIRENVEILAVALAVAMGCRTYFVQPFKIPTGSMQPTLYGITAESQAGKTVMDYFPLNLISLAWSGERYVEIKARVAGQVDNRYMQTDAAKIYSIAGVPHKIPNEMANLAFFQTGDFVAEGQILAAGRLKIGDHIFVDKVRYNFSRPKRGQIIVFSTDTITDPQVRPNTFYIKRLAALPGEEVAINPPYLMINGKRITEPYPFERLLNARDKGYNGYTLARRRVGIPTFLSDVSDRKVLGPRDYLPLGDNSAFSLDGRYFGPIDRESLVGPAFMVYWPFTKRWGTVQ